MKDYNQEGQYVIRFNQNSYMGKEDFMQTSCNQLAYEAINSPELWNHFALCLYGPKSCGKTHLAHIFRENIQQKLSCPVQIPIISASQINLKNMNKIANENDFLIIEDMDNNINQEAFFHLYNFYNVPNKLVLFTSSVPLSKLSIQLADLRSRLNTIPCIEILAPDDITLTILIAKLFNDKQITINQTILDYILVHSERSFEQITKLITIIDDVSWLQKRAVNLAIVKEAFEVLNQNKQMELFL